MAGSIDSLIPEFQPDAHALVDAAGAAGFQPRVTSTLRTRAEQKRLYSRYLAGHSQFPAAPPGRSAHEYGYAIDIVCSSEEEDYALGQYWASAGGVWHPSDRIHYEWPGFEPPIEQPQNIVAQRVQTVADWINELPWYISMLLPLELTSQRTSDKLVTKGYVEEILRKAGL